MTFQDKTEREGSRKASQERKVGKRKRERIRKDERREGNGEEKHR